MITQIGVVVPVADERDHLPGCLDALRQARATVQLARPDVAVRLVFVLDACTDGSADFLAAQADVDFFAVSCRRVGAVRAAGVARILADTADADDFATVWLANTDSDSTVPRSWLSAMLSAEAAGAAVVLGTVTPSVGLTDEVATAWRRQHRLSEGHPHVHGANFGIRADAYLRLGGWRDLATGEDAALAEHASRDPDVVVHRTAAIPVTTSSRTRGVAPDGFAAYLRDLEAALSPLVPGGHGIGA